MYFVMNKILIKINYKKIKKVRTPGFEPGTF